MPQRCQAFGLAISITCLLLAACVPSPYWNTPQAPAGTTPTLDPTRANPTRMAAVQPPPKEPTGTLPPVEGELQVAVREDLQTLNPYRVTNDAETFVVSLLYDTLLESSADGGLRPNLAERWEVTSDGTVLTCWLNPQAQWHDGQPVTATDVVFSFDLVRKTQMPGWVRIAALADRVEAMNAQEVRFTLLAAHWDAVRLLCTELIIVPAHLWQAVSDPFTYTNLESPMGSGPFRLLDFTQGEQVVLGNTQSHHTSRPRVQKVLVQILRDEVRALKALQNDELDALGWGITPSLAHDVLTDAQKYAGIRVLDTQGWDTVTLLLNLRGAPYSSPAFRLAVLRAIDTSKIIEDVLAGFGDTVAGGLFAPASSWQNPDLTPMVFDPEQAGRGLSAAGFVDSDGDGWREDAQGNPLQMPISCQDLGVPLQVARSVVGSLNAIGISSTVTSVAQDKWVPTLLQAQFDAALHEMSFAEVEEVLAAFQSTRGVLKNGRTSGPNYGGYANPQLDELASAIQQARDATTRRELLYQLQAVLAADLPQIPLYSPRVLSLYREDRLTGWSTRAGNGLLNRTTVLGLHPVVGD